MKITFCRIFFISLIFIPISCNNIDQSNNISNDINNKNDSIYENNYEDYLTHRELHLSRYKKFYDIVKNNKFDKKIINIIRGESIFIETIICGVYYNEEIVNDAIVLFYLKGYLAKLKDNYYADFFDDMGDNPYTPIFYTAFLKISNEPPDKGFIMSSCYSWVKKQPKYLKNPDIKLIVDSINFELNKEK